MAEEFNEYFSSCATNLANEIPRIEGDPLRHVPQSTSTLCLQPVDETEVLNELLKLRTKKSTGLDKIPAKLLKDSAPVIVKPLTHIFNLSIATGEIPKEYSTDRGISIIGIQDFAGYPVGVCGISHGRMRDIPREFAGYHAGDCGISRSILSGGLSCPAYRVAKKLGARPQVCRGSERR
ncbi:hypothetical protein Bbelb_052920 [Branchiostoma belcheri]|nr:hypothetical protein Bbelb_052920 [Branchiostoma belcheri]